MSTGLEIDLGDGLVLRKARTSDVAQIKSLVDPLAESRILLAKDLVTYYETIHEFWVVADGARLAACGAVHVIWLDLAEVRTLAVGNAYRGRGMGRHLVTQLLEDARALGVDRVFCLTFETNFFSSLGFVELADSAVSPEVYAELLRSHDEGTAEFLDLARVKPNTLGNTRMIVTL